MTNNPMNDNPMNDNPMNDNPMNDNPMNDNPMNDKENEKEKNKKIYKKQNNSMKYSLNGIFRFQFYTNIREFDYIDFQDKYNFKIIQKELNYFSTTINFRELTKLNYSETTMNFLLKNIKEFVCSHCELDSLPGYVTKMKNLEKLYCNNNNIVKLNLENNENLKELFCGFNKLEDIPNINSLKRLNCEHNNLRSIPKFENLECLMANNNKLQSLPMLEKVQYINCNYNQLSFINDYPNLQYLFFDYNFVKRVPNLPKAKFVEARGFPYLEIKKNKITKRYDDPLIRIRKRIYYSYDIIISDR